MFYASALVSWLRLIATGVGPFWDQAVHFTDAYTNSSYATNRYRREVERYYGLLSDRLAERERIIDRFRGDDKSQVDNPVA